MEKIVYQLVIIALGFYLARTVNRLDDRSLSAVCLFIFLSFTLFLQALGQNLRDAQFTFLFFFYVFHTAILYFPISGILKAIGFSTQTRHLFLLCMILSGQSYLRYLTPQIGAPAEALQTVNLLIFYQLALAAIFGIYLCLRKEKILLNFIELLKIPLLYAAAAGLLLAGFSDSLTYDFLNAINSLHNVSDPLILLIFGVIIGKYIFFFETKEYTGMFPGVFLCVFFKLIISPALALLIVELMGIDQLDLQRGLILSAGVPTGVIAAVLVSFYGQPQDRRFVVLCVLFTVLLSFATMPGLLWIVNRLFPL
jgi:predicted permease